jgi:hypothetical protein
LKPSNITNIKTTFGTRFNSFADRISAIYTMFFKYYGLLEDDANDEKNIKGFHKDGKGSVMAILESRTIMQAFVSKNASDVLTNFIKNAANTLINYKDLNNSLVHPRFQRYLLSLPDKKVLWYVPKTYITNIPSEYNEIKNRLLGLYNDLTAEYFLDDGSADITNINDALSHKNAKNRFYIPDPLSVPIQTGLGNALANMFRGSPTVNKTIDNQDKFKGNLCSNCTDNQPLGIFDNNNKLCFMCRKTYTLSNGVLTESNDSIYDLDCLVQTFKQGDLVKFNGDKCPHHGNDNVELTPLNQHNKRCNMCEYTYASLFAPDTTYVYRYNIKKKK